ncbi:hypothetical protein KY495_03020 [Massilia sp. PAMC28688]|uniref:hypothetical protein n=1 Tax=Massilia sp. PAMC28688 TaxID=2861283 RepID=UPI001C632E8C|nr:hypothetical protein [Massilia sp. PAMC28688]QYF94214.1 hypothetical protein KY495_03020 [Massilia sp. PAMC28688]
MACDDPIVFSGQLGVPHSLAIGGNVALLALSRDTLLHFECEGQLETNRRMPVKRGRLALDSKKQSAYRSCSQSVHWLASPLCRRPCTGLTFDAEHKR